MKRPPPVEDEQARLETLEKYEVLDTPAEQAFDDLVHLAAHVTDASAAMLSLVDEDRQWFKARHGIDQRETRRELSFCAHQLGDPDEMLIVEDATEDPRFQDHPYVREDPGIRFYAGRPSSARRDTCSGPFASSTRSQGPCRTTNGRCWTRWVARRC